MKTYDVVSAFITVRNEEQNIGETLKGLLSQEYPLREIVVINDGSTDRTGIISQFHNDVYEKVIVVNLPYHADSYVGRWELGRIINHGLRKIRESGVPDFILQMGGDHIIPNNYVSELLDRMTDKIRISSGTYEGAQLNINTPIGSGKLIDARLWDKFNGMIYPEKYGFETWIDYRFRKEGYEVARHDDLMTECRPIKMSKKKAYYWGKCSYAQGGVLLFALLKAFSLKGNGLNFLKGYCSRGDVEKHEDIYEYVGDMQYQKAKRQIQSMLRAKVITMKTSRWSEWLDD